jgi:plastocyanin
VNRMRVARLAALLALAPAGLALAAGSAGTRLHRIHVPPPPTAVVPASLPHALAVDEQEYVVRPSHLELAAGQVAINAYNRGMDDHDVTIADASGRVVAQVGLKSGAASSFSADLAPGTYTVYCSLFAGTPQSHEALGMHALVTVR